MQRHSKAWRLPSRAMSTPTPEALLSHARWVRALARSLVRDEQAADDLVQEAWLAALQRPPRQLSRGWLASVVRNAARSRWRRESRLAARERTASRREATRTTDELAAEAEWQRRIVAAVLQLDAPHRDVLLLRFFEDLTPAAIADRLGEPSATVRSRLKRALDMLRARFDREHDGDRRTWALALLPLASRGASAAGALPKIAIAAALLVCVLLVTWQIRGSTAEATGTARDGKRSATALTEPTERTSRPRPPITLAGVVRGQAERPVSGADIRVGDRTTQSAADGSFRIQVPRAVEFQLRASAPGCGPLTLRTVVEADCTGLILQLPPGADLTATIVDIDGQPVGGARVRLCERSGDFRAEVHSATDGTARITDIRADWYTLFVTHPRFAPASRGIRVPSDRLTIRLERGATIEGVTLDRATRAPVEGVRVRILMAGGETPLPDGPVLEAISDSRGKFRLERIPTTSSFDVDIDAGPRGRLTRRWVQPGDHRMLETILLDPEHTVQGIVRGPDGAPVGGLTMRPWDAIRRRDHLVTSDKHGRFVITGRPPLKGRISLVSDRWQCKHVDRGAAFTVHVVPRAITTGRVRDPAGQPVPGARVTSDFASTITDAAGCFALRGSSPRIEQPGYQRAYPKNGAVTLIPREGWTLTGRVTIQAGTPLGGVHIQCNQVKPHYLGGAHYTATWPDGSFTLRGLEPGRQRIFATRRGYRGMQLYVDTRDPVAITLDRGATLRGEVVDEEGAPIAGASVKVKKLMRLIPPVAARTDSRGRFTIHGADTGKVSVEVWAFGRDSQRVRTTLPRTESMRIVVNRGATIEGVVLDAGGTPVIKASVRAGQRSASVGFDGRFRIDGLERGKSYELTAHNSRVRSEAEAQEVFPRIQVAAGDRNVLIRGYRGEAITGTLVGPDGKPLAGIRLSTLPRTRTRVTTDSEGRFRFVGVPRGSYRHRSDDKRFYLDNPPAVIPGAAAVTLRAKRMLSISGRVLGQRPRNCNISAKREDDHSVRRHTSVADDGTFKLASLRPGIWLLDVIARGSSRPTEQRIEAGATGVELTFD